MQPDPHIDAEIRARLFPFPKRHLLSVDDLSADEAMRLLDLAGSFAAFNTQPSRRIELLAGKTVANLFFENSTRTRSSFEIGAKRLGADVVNLDIASSSTAKGETVTDTAVTIDAMGADLMVVRHGEHGAVQRVAEAVGASVLNAGDGAREHPTQALLDALTMRRAFGRLEGLTVAICGDLHHSRVARSNGRLLPRLGARVRLAGPPELLPADADAWGAQVFTDLDSAIAGADVVMMLRIQRERMNLDPAPSAEAFAAGWGLNRQRLAHAAPHVRVMHPGPMNRGVEITSDVADDPALSLIRTQVTLGVAVRMAVMASLSARG